MLVLDIQRRLLALGRDAADEPDDGLGEASLAAIFSAPETGASRRLFDRPAASSRRTGRRRRRWPGSSSSGPPSHHGP